MHGTVGAEHDVAEQVSERGGVWSETRVSGYKIGKWLLIHAVLVGVCVWAPVWNWSSFLVLSVTSYLTMCLGVSIGMHRGVIHQTFEMPVWLRNVLVYLSALPGVAGPLSLLKMHQYRDTYQVQPECPYYFGYQLSPWSSYMMSMFTVYAGPRLDDEGTKGFENNRFFVWLERNYLWQQLPLAALLYLSLGWNGVFWGVIVRVALCFNMVWVVNYIVHTRGYISYPQPGCAEEGRNHLLWGVLSFGEGWHNNHHAFPKSARFGLKWWELDVGYWTLLVMKWVGLVKDVKAKHD